MYRWWIEGGIAFFDSMTDRWPWHSKLNDTYACVCVCIFYRQTHKQIEMHLKNDMGFFFYPTLKCFQIITNMLVEQLFSIAVKK